MIIEFAPGKTLKVLLTIIFILLIGNFITIYLLPIIDYNYNNSIIRLLNFDTEQNIPTMFSFLILGFSSILLLHIAKSNKKNNLDFKTWLFLGFVFMFLAFDEALSLHEVLSSIMNKLFGLEGLLYYAWVIPYGIALLLSLIPLTKFLFKLPVEISRLFFISGAIFVTGAIGLEMFEGNIRSSDASWNMNYNILYSIEETLEMLGISLFIYALLRYIIISKIGMIKIDFKN